MTDEKAIKIQDVIKGVSSIGTLQRLEIPMQIKWVWNDDSEWIEHDYHFEVDREENGKRIDNPEDFNSKPIGFNESLRNEREK